MKRLISCCAAAALALGLAAPAQAEIVTVTYQGTVTSGSDVAGLFAPPGASLAGDSFTTVYTINDSVPAYYTNYPPLSSSIDGGSVYSLVGVPISASITINGAAFHIAGNFYDHLLQTTPYYNHLSQISMIAQDAIERLRYVYVSLSIYSYINTVAESPDYHVPMSYLVQPSDYAEGTFEEYNDDSDTYLTLTPTSVVIADVAAIPEPATWAMLILGLGLIGLAARRRTARATLVA